MQNVRYHYTYAIARFGVKMITKCGMCGDAVIGVPSFNMCSTCLDIVYNKLKSRPGDGEEIQTTCFDCGRDFGCDCGRYERGC